MMTSWHTVYPKKYAHGFVVLCFVVVMKSFIMNSHEVFIHIHQGCFAGTGAIVRLPQCQWSEPDGYGKISQCITTTKHSKAVTVCIFLWIYCTCFFRQHWPFMSVSAMHSLIVFFIDYLNHLLNKQMSCMCVLNNIKLMWCNCTAPSHPFEHISPFISLAETWFGDIV